MVMVRMGDGVLECHMAPLPGFSPSVKINRPNGGPILFGTPQQMAAPCDT